MASENSKNSQEPVRAGRNSLPASDDAGASVVSPQRRSFAKLGVGAPVLMSLVSSPVLAATCYSNMMSGNLSNPTRGNCGKGWSPGGWGQPGGQVHIYTTAGAWAAVLLPYSTAKISTLTSLDSAASTAINKNSVPSTKLLREILTDNPASTYKPTRHLLCAYLNARLSALPNSTFHYALTVAQVIGLANGTIPLPPGYSDILAFLDSTWA